MKKNLKTVRLNKYMSECGVSSRRQADDLITQGKVLINQKVIRELGVKIDPFRDKIQVKGRLLKRVEKKRYILLNKPKNVITTTSDDLSRETVMNYVNIKQRIYPVGRLDRNTTGVLLLTNDGELASQLMHPKFSIKKEYLATLDKKVKREDIAKFRNGMRLKDTGEKVLPCEAKIDQRGENVWLAITQGKNQQVRRMFWTLGYDVKKLTRLSFAGLKLHGLKRGEIRNLTDEELERLQNLVKLK